jgi:hypothetical protein
MIKFNKNITLKDEIEKKKNKKKLHRHAGLSDLALLGLSGILFYKGWMMGRASHIT